MKTLDFDWTTGIQYGLGALVYVNNKMLKLKKPLDFALKKAKGQLTASRNVSYVQGQSPKPQIREYFYYIDHHGQLFLDDARMKNFTSCFKEQQFLEFFFKRLKLNDTDRYQEEFPYFSPCGRERNYVQSDDLPVVFTQIIESEDGDKLSYCGAKSLTVKFEPEKVCMLPQTGRIYHPGIARVCGVGLIKSSIAIELSKHFEFTGDEMQPPSWFTWKGHRYKLTNEIIPLLEKENTRKENLRISS